MYAVIDDEGRIIAYHEEKKIVEKYVDRIYLYHKIKLDIIKIKKKAEYKITNKDDLYLVRYGETYIQIGYLVYIQIASDQIIEDMKYCKDILLRTLELNIINKSDALKLKKASKVMDKIIYKEENYTPSITELNRLKDDYDPYIYNYRMY